MGKKRSKRDRAAPRPKEPEHRRLQPTRVPLQAWWMILMLGIILPALLLTWIAACAWIQRHGVASTKISSYAGLIGASLIAIRWLVFAWMVATDRAIDLGEDAVTFPAVTLFSLRRRHIRYRDIEAVAQRRVSGHASEVVVVMRDRSEVAIPGVFRWTLARIDQELNDRIQR